MPTFDVTLLPRAYAVRRRQDEKIAFLQDLPERHKRRVGHIRVGRQHPPCL